MANPQSKSTYKFQYDLRRKRDFLKQRQGYLNYDLKNFFPFNVYLPWYLKPLVVPALILLGLYLVFPSTEVTSSMLIWPELTLQDNILYLSINLAYAAMTVTVVRTAWLILAQTVTLIHLSFVETQLAELGTPEIETYVETISQQRDYPTSITVSPA